MPNIFDSKMRQLKKTKDSRVYTNLIIELLYEDEKEPDGMNHTKLNDFPNVEHRMTVYELKEMFCE